MFVKYEMAIEKEAITGDAGASDYLRREIPQAKPLDESIHESRIHPEIRTGDNKIEYRLRVHPTLRRFLERPKLLKSEADAKGDYEGES